MKRKVKHKKPVYDMSLPLPQVKQPEAETNHNLFEKLKVVTDQLQVVTDQLQKQTDLMSALDNRTKRLEAAVVPPSAWERVKSSVGM